MERVIKTFKIHPELWIKLKVYCAKKDIKISDFLEKLIEKEVFDE